MPLNYDPSHVVGGVPKPGTYEFRVLGCDEAVFKTGAIGIRVHLSVKVAGRTSLKFVDNVIFGERSTWKMADLCRSTGVRFDPPCDASDLVGRTGRAEFRLDEYDGLIGLAVVRYLPPVDEAARS